MNAFKSNIYKYLGGTCQYFRNDPPEYITTPGDFIIKYTGSEFKLMGGLS